MEKTLKFEHFQKLLENTLARMGEAGAPAASAEPAPEQAPPLVLAYIGDAYFTLYVRTRLLEYEQRQVRILHTFDAQIVSATMQAFALRQLEPALSEQELAVIRRGRNAKSKTPKSASVQDYHYSTGFEALLGYLFLQKEYLRLTEIAEKAFLCIAREIRASKD